MLCLLWIVLKVHQLFSLPSYLRTSHYKIRHVSSSITSNPFGLVPTRRRSRGHKDKLKACKNSPWSLSHYCNLPSRTQPCSEGAEGKIFGKNQVEGGLMKRRVCWWNEVLFLRNYPFSNYNHHYGIKEKSIHDA